MSDWSGLLKDLFRQFQDGSITLQHLCDFTEHRNPFPTAEVREDIVVVQQPPPESVQSVVKLTFNEACAKACGLLGMASEYAEFVKKFGNEQAPGYWTLPMVKAEECVKAAKATGYKLTCNKVFAVLKAELRKLGKDAWSAYDDIDKAVADDLKKNIKRNQRDPNRDGSYLISFKAAVEADEENANQSADDRPWESHKDIVLLERLFLELIYFLMTGENLDVKNWTLCAGSRFVGGDVPYVYFYSGFSWVYVYWCSSDDAHPGLRARSAFSLPTEASKAKP